MTDLMFLQHKGNIYETIFGLLCGEKESVK